MIVILSLFGYIRLGRFSPLIKNFSFLGIWLGLTTTVVGLLTNSFFGDFIPRYIYHDPDGLLYTLKVGEIHLPIQPLRDPLTILTIALIFGLIHLNLGILLAIYQSIRNKKYKTLLTQHFSWIFLEIGGGMLIGSLLLHLWDLSALWFYMATILVFAGLILRLIEAGPLGLFHITGFIGDWLSYARLLALGLATTGMALAFNVIGEIIPQIVPLVGFALVPIILIVAHVANLGIQTLGAGVHSLRLQYVEFFNRFYEGGGKKFKPFSERRRYTKIKEE
jgi:V/A-type H+-transporting ATPase subunit I